MENMDKKQWEDNGHKNSCQNGCCGMHSMDGHGMHHCGKHYLVRMILKIFIVILIFWCGFRLGDMTGSLRAESGYRMMMNRGNVGMMRGYGYSNNLPPVNSGTPTTAPIPAQ